MNQQFLILFIMGLFSSLFSNQTKAVGQSKQQEPEHSVIIEFDYGIEGLDALYKLEDQLEQVIADKNVGDYDGHEIAIDYSDGFLYMYGPNAEELFKAVKPILEETDFMKGAKATLRFGPPEDGVKEIDVVIE